MLRVGIVAGEASGDLLGAGLLEALKAENIPYEAFGVGGARMQAQGFQSWYPIETLSVMGLIEVLGKYRELYRLRKSLAERLLEMKPDLFIGIDLPDFNLGLEKRLHDAGIPVVHYVSPSVWAWRRNRIRRIKETVDHMLVLFPFEEAIYREANIPVTCVGHPLSDEIEMVPAKSDARKALGLTDHKTVVALLPGSRSGEYEKLAPVLIDTASRLHAHHPDTGFLIPAINGKAKRYLEDRVADTAESVPIEVTDGNAQTVLSASDFALVASGTATLEAMLLEKPMVVVYRQAWLTWHILKRMVQIDTIALPNLLANNKLVPELLQTEACVERISEEAEVILEGLKTDGCKGLTERFRALSGSLRKGGSRAAVKAILPLVSANKEAVSGEAHP